MVALKGGSFLLENASAEAVFTPQDFPKSIAPSPTAARFTACSAGDALRTNIAVLRVPWRNMSRWTIGMSRRIADRLLGGAVHSLTLDLGLLHHA